MTNILTKLKDFNKYCGVAHPMMRDAVDEIERLETELAAAKIEIVLLKDPTGGLDDGDEGPSAELCCEVNPKLWAHYCELVGRPHEFSPIWSEVDVINALVVRDMLTSAHD